MILITLIFMFVCEMMKKKHRVWENRKFTRQILIAGMYSKIGEWVIDFFLRN